MQATTAPSTAAKLPIKGFGKGNVIGLTVGLVVASVTVFAGLLCCTRKRRRSKAALSTAPLPAASYYDEAHVQKQPGYHTVHNAFAKPPCVKSRVVSCTKLITLVIEISISDP